jgi:hypothetical protein
LKNGFTGIAVVRSVGNEVRSEACVHERGKGATVYKKTTPFRIVGSGGLGSDNLSQRHALLFQRGDLFADCHQHVAEFNEVGFVGNRPMTRNDDGFICNSGDIGFRSANRGVNAPAG